MCTCNQSGDVSGQFNAELVSLLGAQFAHLQSLSKLTCMRLHCEDAKHIGCVMHWMFCPLLLKGCEMKMKGSVCPRQSDEAKHQGNPTLDGA